jgi:hypothetical protein
MKTDETLSEVFDVTPMGKTEVISKQGDVITPVNDKVEDDYEVSRNNMRVLLQQGQEALNSALEVARQSEHPRAFEVVGNLMKQLADINQQLLDLHQQKQNLDAPKEASKKEVTNNNAIFVGSTAELNKLIKNMAKGE